MSRVAKKPIALVKGVELKSADGQIQVKGPKGTLSIAQPSSFHFSAFIFSNLW